MRIMKLRTAIAAAGLVVVGGLLAQPVAAQSTASASISAIAFVDGFTPITATGINDLDFGTVPAGSPGVPASVSDFGRFAITGEASAAVTVSFTLPTVLSGPGGTIPIAFSATDGALFSPFPAFTTFDPNGPFITAIDGSGNLDIGISGTVFPGATTTTGSYTGTITLTVSYL
jgi:hypothetical protein